MQNEEALLLKFQEDPDQAFAEVFNTYYALVCDRIYRVLGNPVEVEDIAQEIFYELFQKRHSLKIQSSLPAYLRRMAHTRTVNHIRDKKIKWKEDETALAYIPDPESRIEQHMDARDLEQYMTRAIDQLPPKCRLIFSLRRFEEMTNKEISEELGISIKTVENQMTTALKKLKSALSQYKQME